MVHARGGLRVVAAGAGEVFSVREVAELLRVSTATVYALVERGQLEHFRVSNAIRITRAAIERLTGTAGSPSRGGGARGRER